MLEKALPSIARSLLHNSGIFLPIFFTAINALTKSQPEKSSSDTPPEFHNRWGRLFPGLPIRVHALQPETGGTLSVYFFPSVPLQIARHFQPEHNHPGRYARERFLVYRRTLDFPETSFLSAHCNGLQGDCERIPCERTAQK